MMRRIATTIAVATVVVATGAMAGGVPALAASHGAKATTASSFYLSLGDSLAQGVQPNAQGVSVETKQGYPDQLFTALHLGNPTLKLVKLGCPGETTGTMINGGICSYSASSQLAQAAAFLSRHRGHVQLVTIDIGANDLNPCLALTTINQIVACLQQVFPQVQNNLETIMQTLTTASGSGVPPIIGMTYYDPSWPTGEGHARGQGAGQGQHRAGPGVRQPAEQGLHELRGQSRGRVQGLPHDPVRCQGHPARVRQGAQGRRLHLLLHLDVRGTTGWAEHPCQPARLRHYRQHLPGRHLQ